MGQPVQRSDGDGNRYWDREDPFPCLTWCGSQGRLRPDLQRERQCTLPGYSGPWTEPSPSDRVRLTVWMGRPANYDENNYRPAEDISDGCPGGWARSRFAESMLRYRRQRLEGGGHDINVLVHAGTEPQVIEALRYYESQEAAAFSEFNRRRYG